MAKVGEGDSRWIVREREDGKNVNNWHWSDTNCLKYANDGLKERFAGLDLEGEYKVTEVTKCDGDCYTYNRKGRVYLFYDMNMQIGWTGPGNSSGSISLPNVSDDIEKEPMEVSVDVTEKGEGTSDAHRKYLRDARVRDAIQAIILSFLEDLKGRVQTQVKEKTASTTAAATSEATAPAADAKKATSSPGTHAINLTMVYGCSPDMMFDALTDPRRIMGYTGAPAISEPKAGGKFSMYGDTITGEYIEVIQNKRIVQRWRMSSWPEGCLSTVTIELSPENGTTVRLVQNGVPDRDAQGAELLKLVEQGWENNVFNRMRAAFGWSRQDN